MDDSFDVPVEQDESYFFGVMETIFVGWFTFIFIIRLSMSPDKVRGEMGNKMFTNGKLITLLTI